MKKDLTYAENQIKILYEEQFVDMQGNIFPVKDTVNESLYRGCNHNYVSGTAHKHIKNSDGSCRIITYNAERCSICGNILKSDIISEFKYTICPH